MNYQKEEMKRHALLEKTFFGLPESNTEDCEQLIKYFCKDKLYIDAANMTLTEHTE